MTTATRREIRTIEDLRAHQLRRIKSAIRRNGGPIGWKQARQAMWGSAYDPRDAGRDGETILGFIAAGALSRIEGEDGSSTIGLS